MWGAKLELTRAKVDGYTRWLLQEEYISWVIGEEIRYTLTPKARHFLAEWKPQR